MQKRLFGSYFGAVLAAILLAGCGGGEDPAATDSAGGESSKVQEKVTLKMASAFPASLQLIGTNGSTISSEWSPRGPESPIRPTNGSRL